MPQELKVTTINMKSLNQDIEDPIIAGAGDANGRTLRVIFTQEAAAQITDKTKIYLKWYHQQTDIKGYNVFNQVSIDKPPTWEIKWPRKMLQEGDVNCTIELVDDVSIEPSSNFIVHVLSDPYDGQDFIDSDDFSEFQKAVLELVNTNDTIQADYDSKIDELNELLAEVQNKDNSYGLYMTEITDADDDIDNVIHFFHGDTEDMNTRIIAGEIDASDLVISRDDDLIYYIDKDNNPIALGTKYTDNALTLIEF